MGLTQASRLFGLLILYVCTVLVLAVTVTVLFGSGVYHQIVGGDRDNFSLSQNQRASGKLRQVKRINSGVGNTIVQ